MGRRILGGIVGCSAALLLTACGGSSLAPAHTTKQVASVVARDQVALLDAIHREDSCRSIACLSMDATVSRWGKISDYSRTLSRDLKAQKPVPGEIADLTDQTTSAADKVSRTYGDFHDCAYANRDAVLSACSTQMNANEQAWRDMKTTLAGWRPYVGG